MSNNITQDRKFTCAEVIANMNEDLLVDAYKEASRGEGLTSPNLGLLFERLEKVEENGKLQLVYLGNVRNHLGIGQIRYALLQVLAEKFVESLE